MSSALSRLVSAVLVDHRAAMGHQLLKSRGGGILGLPSAQLIGVALEQAGEVERVFTVIIGAAEHKGLPKAFEG